MPFNQGHALPAIQHELVARRLDDDPATDAARRARALDLVEVPRPGLEHPDECLVLFLGIGDTAKIAIMFLILFVVVLAYLIGATLVTVARGGRGPAAAPAR